MLNLTLAELFLRTIPEMFIFLWGVYVVSKEKIKIKNYVIGSIALGLMVFGIRELPIHYGVHTIVNNVLTVCILIIIGIPLVKAIYSTLIMTLLLIGCETINVLLFNLLDINIQAQFNNVIMKSILGLPSLIILLALITSIKIFLKKRGDKVVSN